jgi:hypothetical protein
VELCLSVMADKLNKPTAIIVSNTNIDNETTKAKPL